jgi:hypothetical protein
MMKKLINSVLLVLCVQFIFAQRMQLGSLELVQPSSKTILPARAITTTSTIGRFRTFNARGGIIFEQQASPSKNLSINSISIDYDNGTVVTINNSNYKLENIPVWQLQPIANYANDTNLDVLTIYGSDGYQIKMHPAFIDKLIGLRLLQVDLMLAGNYLELDEAWEIPKIDDKYVYAESEEKLVPLKGKDQAWITSYSNKIDTIIHHGDENWSSYTFTDHNKEIIFSTEKGKIVIEKTPYYLFQRIDTLNYDYEEFKDLVQIYATYLIENIDDAVTFYSGIENVKYSSYFKYLCEMYNIHYGPDSGDIQTKLHYTLKKKDLTNPFKFSPTNCNGDRNCIAFQKISKVLNEKFSDESSVQAYINNRLFFMNKVNEEIAQIKTRNNINENSTGEFAKNILYIESLCDSSIFYINELFEKINHLNLMYMDKKYVSVLNLKSICDDYYEENVDFDLFYYLNSIKQQSYLIKALENTTNSLDANWHILYEYNPLVFDVAKNTAQYSAFFRYIKEKSPDSWTSYVEKVNKLEYDAPDVITPVNFNNTVRQRYEALEELFELME